MEQGMISNNKIFLNFLFSNFDTLCKIVFLLDYSCFMLLIIFLLSLCLQADNYSDAKFFKSSSKGRSLMTFLTVTLRYLYLQINFGKLAKLKRRKICSKKIDYLFYPFFYSPIHISSTGGIFGKTCVNCQCLKYASGKLSFSVKNGFRFFALLISEN